MAFSAISMSLTRMTPVPSLIPRPPPSPHHHRRRFLSVAGRSAYASASVSSDPLTPPPPPPSSPPAPVFDLRSYWTSLIAQIDAELDAAVPVRFPDRIFQAMRYSVLSPGAKRAAPVLCVAACELFGGDRSAAFPTACALEMVHAASLVHDDLPCMDAAQVRRGRPTNHALFGVDMAVLAGDALFPLSYQHIISQTPRELVPDCALIRIIVEIARTVGSTGMAAGQYLDLDSVGTAKEEALTVLEKKYGEMAECSAVCGGLLGGAGEEELESLRRYGRAMGVLYEVVDDILMEDTKPGGSSENGGKMRSKASVVRVYGVERAMEIVEELREKARQELHGFSKYGMERVLPLFSFLDYAVERGFEVRAGGHLLDATAAPAATTSPTTAAAATGLTGLL